MAEGLIQYIVQGGALGICLILAILLYVIFRDMQRERKGFQETINNLALVIKDNSSVLVNNTKAFDTLYQAIFTFHNRLGVKNEKT